MIINNENKRLSRNRKQKNQRRIQMDDNMKLLTNKIKSEKKKKIKTSETIKQLEILLLNVKYANNPNKLKNALKELNKIHIVNKNLHEIKQEILLDYNGEFEMVDNFQVCDQIRRTHIRFRNSSGYETYFNTIDEGYDAEDCIINGCIYKINTPQFNQVNRSQYGNGCSFDKKIIECRGNNCLYQLKDTVSLNV